MMGGGDETPNLNDSERTATPSPPTTPRGKESLNDGPPPRGRLFFCTLKRSRERHDRKNERKTERATRCSVKSKAFEIGDQIVQLLLGQRFGAADHFGGMVSSQDLA